MDDHDQLTNRLRAMGAEPVDPALQAAHLAAMAHASAPRLSSLRPKLRVAAALLAGFLLGSTGLAAANALPDPAQRVAHSVLGQVGIDVPKPDRYHAPECGAEVKRNHGAYVRDDKTLATSDCGKPIKSVNNGESKTKDGTEDEVKEPKAAAGPCDGPPVWATDRSMTAEEKAAARAERTALCGEDADDGQELEDADDTEGAEELEAPKVDEPKSKAADPGPPDVDVDTPDVADERGNVPGVDDEETTTTTTG